MLVTFESDGSIVGKGFEAHYTKKEGGMLFNTNSSMTFIIIEKFYNFLQDFRILIETFILTLI